MKILFQQQEHFLTPFTSGNSASHLIWAQLNTISNSTKLQNSFRVSILTMKDLNYKYILEAISKGSTWVIAQWCDRCGLHIQHTRFFYSLVESLFPFSFKHLQNLNLYYMHTIQQLFWLNHFLLATQIITHNSFFIIGTDFTSNILFSLQFWNQNTW